jgi:hypothetical protein
MTPRQTGAISETWRNALPRVGVRQMQLDHGQLHTGDRVAQGDGTVCVRAGIENDTIGRSARGLKRIDQRTFVIALLERDTLAPCSDAMIRQVASISASVA